MPLLFAVAMAFCITMTCIWLLIPLALRLKLVDSPGGRKQHEGHVPLIGGMAMFIGLLFSLLVLPLSLLEYRSFIAGLALLVFVGVLDDFHELTPRVRLISQVIAGLLMAAWGKVRLEDLGSLFFHADIMLYDWALPLTVVAVVGLINAVNMTDGLDGLGGGLALVEVGILLLLTTHAGQGDIAHVLCLVFAVILGFLVFNFPWFGLKGAKVFMGDAGSMFLGFILVWFSVKLSQQPIHIVSPVIMLWVMAIPVFDTAGVMLYRLLNKRSVFAADREHLHYRIYDMGFNSAQTTLIICSISLILGLTGLMGHHLRMPDGVMFFSFLGAFALYLGLMHYLQKMQQSKLNVQRNIINL